MYVITGATGNTGSVIAKTLLGLGQKVRVIGRNAERLQPLAAAGADAFVGDVKDSNAMTEAFAGAGAVFAMIPPVMTSNDYRAEQQEVMESIAAAIEANNTSYVVSLSSVGADKSSGTGPVVGLHRLEERLNSISGLNVLHLRAAYFMENTLAQIGVIRSMGITAGPLRPDLSLPMIATRDIGAAAAQELLQLQFEGKQTKELLGERDLTMLEVARIIGNAIGKPDLAYFQAAPEQFRAAMMQIGTSANTADLILEMAGALNSGQMKALEQRSPVNTTPTSFETFVAEEFLPAYQGR